MVYQNIEGIRSEVKFTEKVGSFSQQPQTEHTEIHAENNHKGSQKRSLVPHTHPPIQMVKIRRGGRSKGGRETKNQQEKKKKCVCVGGGSRKF